MRAATGGEPCGSTPGNHRDGSGKDPEIQKRIKELRLARGWMQEQLAQAVGVSRQSIHSIEREGYVPSLPLALTFARIFECPTDEIFRLENKC